MLKIFANWEWWQIALTAVFGTVWIFFIILDKTPQKKPLRSLDHVGSRNLENKAILTNKLRKLCNNVIFIRVQFTLILLNQVLESLAVLFQIKRTVKSNAGINCRFDC